MMFILGASDKSISVYYFQEKMELLMVRGRCGGTFGGIGL